VATRIVDMSTHVLRKTSRRRTLDVGIVERSQTGYRLFGSQLWILQMSAGSLLLQQQHERLRRLGFETWMMPNPSSRIARSGVRSPIPIPGGRVPRALSRGVTFGQTPVAQPPQPCCCQIPLRGVRCGFSRSREPYKRLFFPPWMAASAARQVRLAIGNFDRGRRKEGGERTTFLPTAPNLPYVPAQTGSSRVIYSPPPLPRQRAAEPASISRPPCQARARPSAIGCRCRRGEIWRRPIV
jgi:hypothetical protein